MKSYNLQEGQPIFLHFQIILVFSFIDFDCFLVNFGTFWTFGKIRQSKMVDTR